MSILRTNQITNTAGTGSPIIPGAVLQVVQTIGTTSQSTTSTSYVNYSYANVSITPSSTNSKILVQMECGVDSFDSGTNASTSVKIYKDGSPLSNEKTVRTYVNGGNGVLSRGSAAINHLDSPSTTSSITYQLYFKRDQGSYNNTIQNASITLMEIGG
jgi:hypothetical protein